MNSPNHDNFEDASPPLTFAYPGSVKDYRVQALGVAAWIWGLCTVLLLILYAVDRLWLGSGGGGLARLTALYATALAITVFALLLARSLAVFRIEASPHGLRILRLGGTVDLAFDGILSVEKIRLPAWWPFRADLRPWRESARWMVRIRPKSGPAVTFLGGIGGEEDLLALIEESLTSSPPVARGGVRARR